MSSNKSGTGVARWSEQWTWFTLAGVVLTIVIGSYILFAQAAPPKSLVIAAGAKEGQYYEFAQRYAQTLSRHGIHVTVLETKGSVENLKLLLDPDNDVTVAFVQGGVATPDQKTDLLSLGSLYREPLWIFTRATGSEQHQPISHVTQFASLRVAAGSEGSGTRPVVQQLLEAYDVPLDKVQLVDAGGQDAADLLEKGEIDVACFVAGFDAEYVRRLGASPSVRLMGLDHQQALARRFRQLSPVTVPAGMLSLAGQSPPADVNLIAPTANLVVTENLHPALASVLMQAAVSVHAKGDALSEPGEFPASRYLDFPLSSDAENFYRHGPPLLQRLLPFWLAAFVDRVKLLALPMLMLAMPLIRATPPLLRWRTRRKVYLWYDQLRALDHLMKEGMSSDQARASMADLQELESQIVNVEIPLSYMSEYYNLRLHLNLVTEKLRQIIAAG